MVLTVQKTVEVVEFPQLQILDKLLSCPLFVQRQVSMVLIVAEGPRRFHRCGSWACQLFSTTGAHGPDRAEALGDAAVALYSTNSSASLF